MTLSQAKARNVFSVANECEFDRFQIMEYLIVRGLVFGKDLEDDLVGSTIGNTKLRSNIYHTEDENWRDIKVGININCPPPFASCVHLRILCSRINFPLRAYFNRSFIFFNADGMDA